jgi:hypothetical protein
MERMYDCLMSDKTNSKSSLFLLLIALLCCCCLLTCAFRFMLRSNSNIFNNSIYSLSFLFKLQEIF